MTTLTTETVKADHVGWLAESPAGHFYEDVMASVGRKIGDPWTVEQWHDAVLYMLALADDREPGELVERREFLNVATVDWVATEHPASGESLASAPTVAVKTLTGRYILTFSTDYGTEVLDLYRVIDDA